jgi:hypothetical protein
MPSKAPDPMLVTARPSFELGMVTTALVQLWRPRFERAVEIGPISELGLHHGGHCEEQQQQRQQHAHSCGPTFT